MSKLLRKSFTFVVVALTILWSVGMPSLVQAVDACPTLVAGDVWKNTATGATTVWVLNSALEKIYFPNEDVYKTWFAKSTGVPDWSVVKKLSPTCSVAFQNSEPKAGPRGVNFLPGSVVFQHPGGLQYFVTEAGNKKTEISEVAAAELFGTTWKSKVVRFDDMFNSNWASNGTKMDTARLGEGWLVQKTGETTVYQVVGGKLVKVDGSLTGSALKAVRPVTATLFATAEMLTTTVTPASVTVNPVQYTGAGTGTGTGTTPVTNGNVSVGLSANTSAGGNVVINIDNVVFGKFMLTATNGDYTVSSVTIGRKGLGAKTDFTSVTLYDGATKLGTSKTSWDSNTQTMVYNIPTGVKITNGTTKELTVVAKLDTAGTYNSLGILAVNGTAVTAVYGNEMTGVDVSVGGITISNMGTAATRKIGITGTNMAEFKLTVSSTEDGEFKAITLKNKAATNNASDTDVANLYLYKGATKLAGPVQMVSDKITFTLDIPVSIDKSKNEIFKVIGDVVDGPANTVEFVLENTTDLVATGKTYETALAVHNDSYNAAAAGAIITIGGAELNIAYTGANLDTIDDVTDVNFGTLKLSAGSTDIKITSLVLHITETEGSGAATDNLDVDNFELIESNGGAYSGAETSVSDTTAAEEVWTFADEIYLTAGQTRTFTMRGDLPNGIGNGDSYKVSGVINTAHVTAETVPAGDTVSSFSIGSFTGNLITVKAPTLVVTGLTQNSGTAVVNDANVILYKGTLEAQASDIKVSYANFNAYTTFNTNHWTEVGFYLVNADGSYDQKQLLTTSQMTSSTSVSGDALSFDSLDFTVKNGSANKVTFVIKGTVAGTLTSANGLVNKLKLDYITAKASDNSSPTVSGGGHTDLDTADGTFLEDGYRQVTLADKGKLYVQMRNGDSGFNKDRILLAGTSAWVGKLKLKADDENIKIKDLKLTNVTTSGADDDLTSVCLYRAQVVTAENLISCQTVDSSGVVFYDDINQTVVQGTAYWYIYVNSNKMSNLAGGEADSNTIFSFRIATSTAGSVAAEGVRSGFTYVISDDASADAGDILLDQDNDDTYDEAAELDATTSTKQFVIAGTKINDVQLVSAYGGYTVDTVLTGTDTFTAAILAVTTAATDNTDGNGNALQTQLKGLHFDVSKYASTSLSAVTIQKIGGSNAAGSLYIDDAGSATLNSTTSTSGTVGTSTMSGVLADDYKLDPNTISYFVIKATVNSVLSTANITNYFRFDLNDIKGTYTDGGVEDDANNNVDWNDGYVDSSASASLNYSALLLDTESITGTKVQKTNT